MALRRAGFALAIAAIAVTGSRAHALQIELSNEFYYAYSNISESTDGEIVTGSVDDSRSNSTGGISAFVETAYATASAEIAGARTFSAHSAIDGLAVLDAGLRSASAEGGILFDTDFVVHGESGDPERARVEIVLSYSESFVSTDPRDPFPFGGDGTVAGSGNSTIAIYRSEDFRFVAHDFLEGTGQRLLSGIVDVGARYHIQTALNATTAAIRTVGSADALSTLEIVSISALPTPEPATGIMVGFGLTGLAMSRGPRRARRK